VFGDIYVAEGRGWFEARVKDAGMEFMEPIRGEGSSELLSEFVETGGRAVITCVDLGRLDESWLGRIIDERFMNEIKTTAADPCGENGEYHSFAYDGPMFKHPIRWRTGETRSALGFIQLDVLPG
jgi:diphthamide synthase (EF-2-diphthine--ammonia ligase)